MSERRRIGVLIACLAVSLAIIVGVSLSSGSADSIGDVHPIRLGQPTVQTFTGSGVVCGVVGPNPTRADVEQFAAKAGFNADQTRQLLACYGFPASG